MYIVKFLVGVFAFRKLFNETGAYDTGRHRHCAHTEECDEYSDYPSDNGHGVNIAVTYGKDGR